MTRRTMEPKHIGGQSQASDRLLEKAMKLLENRSMVDNYFVENPKKTEKLERFGDDIETPLAEYFMRRIVANQHQEITSFLEGNVPISVYSPKTIAPIFLKFQMNQDEIRNRIEFDSTLFEDEFEDQVAYRSRTKQFITDLLKTLDDMKNQKN